MLVAFTGMVQANISGNLMSLGAIDFGLIVDGAVVMVENIIRHLGYRRNGDSMMGAIRAASQEVARPIFFAVAIIVIVYVPILTLGGVEGKMFRPMAATVLFALIGSLILALTLMPVLSWFAFRNGVPKKETWLMRRLHALYEPLLAKSLHHPFLISAFAVAVFALSVFGASKLGAEFIPQLDEGSILVQMYRLPGISIDESLHGNEIIEKVLREFPEVRGVFSRTGRPDGQHHDAVRGDGGPARGGDRPDGVGSKRCLRHVEAHIGVAKASYQGGFNRRNAKAIAAGSSRSGIQLFSTHSDAHAGINRSWSAVRYCNQSVRG